MSGLKGIGVVDSFSSPASGLVIPLSNAERISVAQINAADGIKGHGGWELELVSYDPQRSVQTGRAVMEKTLQDGDECHVRHDQSSVTLATTAVAERGKLPK